MAKWFRHAFTSGAPVIGPARSRIRHPGRFASLDQQALRHLLAFQRHDRSRAKSRQSMCALISGKRLWSRTAGGIGRLPQVGHRRHRGISDETVADLALSGLSVTVSSCRNPTKATSSPRGSTQRCPNISRPVGSSLVWSGRADRPDGSRRRAFADLTALPLKQYTSGCVTHRNDVQSRQRGRI